MKRVMFILKRREDYNAQMHNHIGLSTGLYNSASFVNDMLVEKNIESKLVVVTDNNDIDREVTAYKPTHVIIEALWVVPSKFTVLEKLHPTVKWIIRLHSEMPFMAGEGMAMDWLGDYSSFDNIIIAINAPRMLAEIRDYLQIRNSWSNKMTNEKVIYLPNYYPQTGYKTKTINCNKEHIDIACFGAIRPLKNHLVQAFASLDFAKKINKKLRFHVNAGRIEMQGHPVINNLKGLFTQLSTAGHELVNHQWTPRDHFLKLCSTMDLGLQCSFSETFNIVGADLISQGVPLIGSTEIPWSISWFNANPTNSQDISTKLSRAYDWSYLNVKSNQWSLTCYTTRTQEIWVKYFK